MNYDKYLEQMTATYNKANAASVSRSPSTRGIFSAIATRQGRKALRANEIGKNAQFTNQEVVRAGRNRIIGRAAAGLAVAALVLPAPRHALGELFDQTTAPVQDRAPVPSQIYVTPDGPAQAPTTPAPAPTAEHNVAQDH